MFLSPRRNQNIACYEIANPLIECRSEFIRTHGDKAYFDLQFARLVFLIHDALQLLELFV